MEGDYSEQNEATPVNRMQRLRPDLQKKYFGTSSDAYVTYGVHGEGTCFFHSFLAATNAKGYLTLPDDEQKKLAYKYRCKLKKTYDKKMHDAYAKKSTSPRPFDEVVEDFCDKSAWADETMIRHAADMVGANIIFLDDSSGKIYCGVRGKEPAKQPTIVVRWVSKAHFEPIMRVVAKNPKKKLIAVRGVFEPFTDESDAKDIGHLMKQYAA